MITFDDGNRRFTYRAVSIVLHAGRVLLQRLEGEDYWALPGGRVEWLEPAGQTVRREMGEELGVEARVERLVWVAENFFEDRGRAYHEIALYFLVSFPAGAAPYQHSEPFYGDEEGTRLIFGWFPLDRLEAMPLYPTFLRTRLRALPPAIEYIVHHDG